MNKEVMRTYPKPKKVCHKKNKMQEVEKERKMRRKQSKQNYFER